MMKSKTPDATNTTTSDQPIEAFFAHMGLTVEVVVRCPVAGCEQCQTRLDQAA